MKLPKLMTLIECAEFLKCDIEMAVKFLDRVRVRYLRVEDQHYLVFADDLAERIDEQAIRDGEPQPEPRAAQESLDFTGEGRVPEASNGVEVPSDRLTEPQDEPEEDGFAEALVEWGVESEINAKMIAERLAHEGWTENDLGMLQQEAERKFGAEWVQHLRSTITSPGARKIAYGAIRERVTA